MSDRELRRATREGNLKDELLWKLRTGDLEGIKPYALTGEIWYELDFVVSYESPQNTGDFETWRRNRLIELIEAYRNGLVQESLREGHWRHLILEEFNGRPLGSVGCRLNKKYKRSYYLIKRVEKMVEKSAPPTTLPRLSDEYKGYTVESRTFAIPSLIVPAWVSTYESSPGRVTLTDVNLATVDRDAYVVPARR